MNRSLIIILVTLFCILSTSSCSKDGFFTKPKTTIKIQVIDNSGDTGECNIQLWWEPNGASEKQSQRVYPLEEAIFEDVKPGDWRCKIGTLGETDKRFKIAEGQTVQLTYERYIKGYLNIGWVSAPIWGWKCSID